MMKRGSKVWNCRGTFSYVYIYIYVWIYVMLENYMMMECRDIRKILMLANCYTSFFFFFFSSITIFFHYFFLKCDKCSFIFKYIVVRNNNWFSRKFLIQLNWTNSSGIIKTITIMVLNHWKKLQNGNWFHFILIICTV